MHTLMLGDRFQDVLAKAASGEATAFADLWCDAHPDLVRYLRVLAGAHAEDVASETWLKVIARIDSFSGTEDGFRAWLVTIARNTYVDLLRRPQQRSEVSVSDLRSFEGTPTDRLSDTASLVIDRLSTDAALEVIARLPHDQAEMIMLRVAMGLTVSEVAAIMSKSPGAVRVSVHRGLKQLEGLLRQAGVTPEAGIPLLSRDG